MDKHAPIFDKSLLIPLLIRIASLLGICLITVLEWPRGQDSQTIPAQTETPFKYALLATYTIIPPPEFDIAASQEIFPTPVAMLQESETPFPALMEQIATSLSEVFTPTAAIPPNPVFDKIAPMAIGTYDDSDSYIVRAGNWINESNVDSAYQGTLLISHKAGNYVAFSFIGTLMVLGYQSSLDEGDVTININGLEHIHAQAVGFEWISEELLPGRHYVILTHESGTSVNLDYIDIPN
jgi:hypothetical protein